MTAVRVITPDVARLARVALGLRQRDIADLAGCCAATYKRFERGQETGLTTQLAFTLCFVHLLGERKPAEGKL